MTDDREMWYRVPRSAEECAVHLEAGGVVEINDDGRWRQTTAGARSFREATPEGFGQDEYRLVYSSPVGMSPVIGAPGHAYGVAKDAPAGWGRRGWENTDSWNVGAWEDDAVIEARPPAPEPRTEKVPLTKLVGRTLVGETEPVEWIRWACGEWRWGPVRVFAPTNNNTLILTVDVETGMVEVLAEEEA